MNGTQIFTKPLIFFILSNLPPKTIDYKSSQNCNPSLPSHLSIGLILPPIVLFIWLTKGDQDGIIIWIFLTSILVFGFAFGGFLRPELSFIAIFGSTFFYWGTIGVRKLVSRYKFLQFFPALGMQSKGGRSDRNEKIRRTMDEAENAEEPST